MHATKMARILPRQYFSRHTFLFRSHTLHCIYTRRMIDKCLTMRAEWVKSLYSQRETRARFTSRTARMYNTSTHACIYLALHFIQGRVTHMYTLYTTNSLNVCFSFSSPRWRPAMRRRRGAPFVRPHSLFPEILLSLPNGVPSPPLITLTKGCGRRFLAVFTTSPGCDFSVETDVHRYDGDQSSV